MTFAEARKLLTTGPLVFGDEQQVIAVRTIEAVEAVIEADKTGHCFKCDGSKEIECGTCEGSCECLHCGGPCGQCQGDGMVDCDCGKLEQSKLNALDLKAAMDLLSRVRVAA